MASVPEEYFKNYTKKGASKLLRTLHEQEDIHWENEHREFKSGEAFNKIQRAKEPKERDLFTNELRATWAEVVGAFANTGGGVLVFGIHAKAEGGIDKPQSVVPVSEPSALVTRLKKWALDATDPPLGGIKYETVKSGREGEAFVVCLIPEGKQKPYRSKGTAKEFYMRVDDNCIAPSLSLLKQLFTPQRYPRVNVVVEEYSIPKGHHPFVALGFLAIHFQNVGEYTLDRLAAYVEVDGDTILQQEDKTNSDLNKGMPLRLDGRYVNPDYNVNAMCGWKYPCDDLTLTFYLSGGDFRQLKGVVHLDLPLKEKKYTVLMKPQDE